MKKELPNLDKSTENLSKIKDKDEWLREVKGNSAKQEQGELGIEGSKASDITDESLFIGKDWKKKYTEWICNPELHAYLPTHIEQIKWIEDNLIKPLKSQIAGYRVLTRKLIKRRDELLQQQSQQGEHKFTIQEVCMIYDTWRIERSQSFRSALIEYSNNQNSKP